MACIEARGLRKAFGTTVAVDGVDLRVEEGRILGLIGPNGAGKTTLFEFVAGTMAADAWTFANATVHINSCENLCQTLS